MRLLHRRNQMFWVDPRLTILDPALGSASNGPKYIADKGMPTTHQELSRAITIVILIQTIFLLSIFAEIFVTTGGAYGTRTLTYLIFQRIVDSQNIGLGSAGGVYAIILANIVALFLMRIVGKNLDA